MSYKKMIKLNRGTVLINGIELVGVNEIEVTQIHPLERTDENDMFIYIELQGDSFAGHWYNSEVSECTFSKEDDDIYSIKIQPKAL